MKPEQQRIAIAEACGWEGETYGPSWCESVTKMPDYLNDLNAMHEAEAILTKTQRQFYQVKLMKLQKADYVAGYWFLIHATAAQRAEAFLRAIEK
jgi:hypothetical protein